MNVTRLRCLLAVITASLVWPLSLALAQSPIPLTDAQRVTLEQDAKELRSQLEAFRKQSLFDQVDAVIFSKGLDWALRYDGEFAPSDIQQMQRAVQRARQRLDLIKQGRLPWTSRKGKIALGYRSVVDDSVQPYGVIVPNGYDGKTPIRLDVVLHGSSRPVGMSELRFINRFDEGDEDAASPPDQPFIELHPLGRVENCYRWAGETDVFEAIQDICRRYQIDRTRIVLRGMSMGASGTWHLGLKHPDRFVALGPYCGYVDTHKFSQTPIPGFVVVGPLPEHQEQGLHMLDSVDYAANAGVVPAIGCIGGKDVFFDAHVIMREAMAKEGLTMTNLISPDTGHVIDPVTQTEQLRRIAEHVADGYQPRGKLRFVTWTLKYAQCHWLQILGLKQHYARAEFSGRLENDVLVVDEPINISKFAIDVTKLPAPPKSVRVGGAELSVKPSDQPQTLIVSQRNGQWQWDELPMSRTVKRPGLQGPIDDAFATPFLCVRGTGQAWNSAVRSYADASLKRFADEWHQYFRGELPIKNDVDVTSDDWVTKNLILFGDPGSNSLISRVLPELPMKWTREALEMDATVYPAIDHVPALIAPNPLPGADGRYVVLNSGHTFRKADLSKFNYLLFPRWGDWAVLKLDPTQSFERGWDDSVLKAGYFDEVWQNAAKSSQ